MHRSGFQSPPSAPQILLRHQFLEKGKLLLSILLNVWWNNAYMCGIVCYTLLFVLLMMMMIVIIIIKVNQNIM